MKLLDILPRLECLEGEQRRVGYKTLLVSDTREFKFLKMIKCYVPACALYIIFRIACEITHFESGDVTQKKISKEHGLLYDKVPLPLTP